MGFNSLGRIVLIDTTLGDGSTISTSGSARSLDLIDCSRSRRLVDCAHQLSQTVEDRPTDVGEVVDRARERIQQLRETGTPWWVVTAGTTMLAFCVCMQVGVEWRGWVSAALVQAASCLVGVVTGKWQMPKLFAITAQGCVAGALATALVQLGLVSPVAAAAAIAVAWLILVPLPQVIGAVSDAINADYLSANSRIASVAVAALGIVIAGAFTFMLGEVLGMEHPRLDTLPSLPWYLVIVFSALGAIANALANGGRWPLVGPAAGLGVITASVNLMLLDWAGLQTLWASSFSGVVLGAMAAFLASRTGYPRQVLALMGITGALMPGIPVFYGILQQMGGGQGGASFGSAAAISVGISTGVALGGYLMDLVRRRDPI
ncbi:threonine/serine exporter family protein [Acidipropionibacterium virtanenii]|uniref:Threonine/serine exporter-like N-terminal domain-containing protein n=1 Tax=Acidipropionibacterium virtanenii TaxID=2057246 RepID=A0A344UU99_9ACTN|nr:threonine/serine exporter family protein [Acidipropionibacterium virtanenii]AXE38847.1 hypothetical protein JS278_01684 [Acidipropionibacterium virtanenii]